jgi:hypothetical protein
LWQFKFECCPQVPESALLPQLSCFGVVFSLCLITGGLFLCLTPFLWVNVSDPSAGPLLSMCCDDLLFVLQFCRAVWLWMLLTGSGEEFYGPLHTLFQAAAYHPPTVGTPAIPAICLLKVWVEIRSSPSSLLQCAFRVPTPSAVCWFSVHCLIFSFFFKFFYRGSVCSGGYACYPRDGWGNTMWFLALICLLCWMFPKQVWTCHLVAVTASLFSQCNVMWRSFLWGRGSGCRSFDSPWCVISFKCGFSISAWFLIHRAQVVFFHTLVAIFSKLESWVSC